MLNYGLNQKTIQKMNKNVLIIIETHFLFLEQENHLNFVKNIGIVKLIKRIMPKIITKEQLN